MKKSQGFTLFEMVIAVSIFAIMGVIAFTGLSQMTRSGEALAEANERLSDMQFAMVYFSRDWTQVSQRKILNQYGDEERNILIRDDAITFTRSGWSNVLQRPRSNLQRVQYLVINNQLVRRYWRSLDQFVAEQPLEAVLLGDVEAMTVNFLDSSGEPIRTWPVETTTGPSSPVVLEFSLELGDMGRITRLLEVPGGAI